MMWLWIYLAIAVVVFISTLSISLWDTITLDRYVKEAFGYDSGKLAILEDCLWDFGLAFAAGLLWPVFLVALIVGGTTWIKK